MAAKKKRKPGPPAEPPRIYEASLASGPSGAVLKGAGGDAEIDLATAIARRRAGLDVVVCGNDLRANGRLAQKIEAAVGPYIQEVPHKRAGPYALPHFQQKTRNPEGHAFYETDNLQRKARKKSMKYFTPELLSRIQSLDDDVSVEAHHEWERAIVRSNRRWKKIKSAFPKEVQRFDDEQVCLHDAELLSMGRQGNNFVMVLKLEPPSQNMALLTFILDGEPVIDNAAIPGRHESDYVTWMYEEFDLDRDKKCCFEVLLSNGWSVKLRFRGFRFLIGEQLIPVPKASAETAVSTTKPKMPQSA